MRARDEHLSTKELALLLHVLDDPFVAHEVQKVSQDVAWGRINVGNSFAPH